MLSKFGQAPPVILLFTVTFLIILHHEIPGIILWFSLEGLLEPSCSVLGHNILKLIVIVI